MEKQSRFIPVEKLIPYADNPYKVAENEELDLLRDSIRKNGILTPLTVRPVADGKYQVLSGHRRLACAEKLGLKEVPVYIINADDDEAAIAVADGNLHRENLLPSEKAFAYRLKLNAIRHQGSCRDGTKLRSDEIIGGSSGESARKVQRYIRLTFLTKELLSLCDSRKIAVSVGAELSFIPEDKQKKIYETCCAEDCTPSYSQAWHLHRSAAENTLTDEEITAVLSQPKPNQRERVTIPLAELSEYTGGIKDGAGAKKFVLEACKFYSDYLSKQKKEIKK